MKPLLAIACALAVLALAFWLWTPDRDRASLEAKYLASPGDMRRVAGMRLHMRESGVREAPAIILLHGFGSSLQTWDDWSAGLAATHRVIRFDLPGSGLSEPDPSGDYSDARSMGVLLALMDGLDIGHASIVGNSMGGRIAWNFAALHPDRVDKLVLVSPDGFATPGYVYGSKPEVPFSMQLMRYVLPKPLLRSALAAAYANPSALTDAIATRYYDLMLAPGVRPALVARLEQALLVDPVPLLRRVQAKTLLLWGEEDALIPVANASDYLRAMPAATLQVLPGVGHVPQEEAPEASLLPVRAFLR